MLITKTFALILLSFVGLSKTFFYRTTLLSLYDHGTRVAGLAAAEANNGICGVGVAYEAAIGGKLLKLISG